MMYLECESVGEHTCTSYYSFFSTLSSSFYSALSSSFTTTPDIITIDSCWLSLVESLIFNKGVTSFFKNQRIDKWYLSSLPFFKDIIDYPCVIVGCWEDHHPSIQRAPLRGAIETTGSERSFFCAGVAGPFLLDMSPSRSQKDLDRTGRTRKSAVGLLHSNVHTHLMIYTILVTNMWFCLKNNSLRRLPSACACRVWYTSGTQIARMDPYSNPIAGRSIGPGDVLCLGAWNAPRR